MSFKNKFRSMALLALSGLFLSACASSQMKARKEAQAKVAQSSKLYCEFINGSIYHDVDVALNLEMAKRCDSDKPYTITQYKTTTEDNGILYCCSLPGAKSAVASSRTAEKPAPTADKVAPVADKPADKAPEKKADDEIE